MYVLLTQGALRPVFFWEFVMKCFRFNYFANYRDRFGEIWAFSRYDVEKQILNEFPHATGIYIWLVH